MTPDNPAHRVRQVFARIGDERMAGLPLLNAALEVEVVGFLDWSGMHLGVLITPWCVNLMALPHPQGTWQPPEEGVWRLERFPGMELQLLGGEEADLGRYAFRSLLSPVTGYDTQDAVRGVAREVLKQLLRPAESAAPVEAGAVAPSATPPTGPVTRRRVSRRQLLGGV